MFEVLTNILEMFESSASDGLSIREVVEMILQNLPTHS